MGIRGKVKRMIFSYSINHKRCCDHQPRMMKIGPTLLSGARELQDSTDA